MAVLDKGVWYPDKEVGDLAGEDSFSLPKEREAGRYHLYVSLACPFAHRPYLVINYLGLQHAISVSSVAAKRGENGWLFDSRFADIVGNTGKLADLYLKAYAAYSGRVSVPVLWDKKHGSIAGNDSSKLAWDIARNWLALAKNPVELLPSSLESDILSMNNWLHKQVNRKVYHVGFATDQQTYDAASMAFFDALEILELRLEHSRYLFADQITLSDFFLLPTLVRMEAVYEIHFKANLKPLRELPNLYRYMLDLTGIGSIRRTIDIEHMKTHYYFSHRHINPTGIIPRGPRINW